MCILNIKHLHIQASNNVSIIQGRVKLNSCWKDRDGNIYEWDSRHGVMEKYN
ncbi:colicin E3/pyocin S6 family cytotoxin [Haemophilus sputorum]|uniref:colicin E3/pyocin S6 family cytotoxin n=1 Tax=Haemophilus sputorum TaxID=1078480 RepID=UPI0034E57551